MHHTKGHTQASIRRRSGCYPDQGGVDIGMKDSTLVSTILAEGSDWPTQQSTTLVCRSQTSPTPLQLLALSNSSTLSIMLSPKPPSPRTLDAHLESMMPFSPVPLTPRPDALSRTGSANSQGSEMPRLPTPDFANPRATNISTFTTQATAALRAVLAHSLSVVTSKSSAPAISLRSAPPPYRPRSTRRESNASLKSACSRRSVRSIDSGHTFLIPSIGTTDKFTHKWPKPHPLRKMEGRAGVDGKASGVALGEVAALALEEGSGLGMDSVEKWTISKWCILCSIITVFTYGGVGLLCAIVTWFGAWDHADVMYVADGDILILITLASSILLFTSLMGMTGALLNSRPILAVYTVLLWPALTSLLAVGYVSYKRSTFALDHKLNLSWSQYYTPLGRLLIQDSLRCCGFYSPLHEATTSTRCYSRTSLPGCKGKLFRFEKTNLDMIWYAVFSIAPLHLVNMVVALLCANHMTSTFGKGLTPKQYRLSNMDVRADAEKILKQIHSTGVRRVMRPVNSRASSSGIFREDRRETAHLLNS